MCNAGEARNDQRQERLHRTNHCPSRSLALVPRLVVRGVPLFPLVVRGVPLLPTYGRLVASARHGELVLSFSPQEIPPRFSA